MCDSERESGKNKKRDRAIVCPYKSKVRTFVFSFEEDYLLCESEILGYRRFAFQVILSSLFCISSLIVNLVMITFVCGCTSYLVNHINLGIPLCETVSV